VALLKLILIFVRQFQQMNDSTKIEVCKEAIEKISTSVKICPAAVQYMDQCCTILGVSIKYGIHSSSLEENLIDEKQQRIQRANDLLKFEQSLQHAAIDRLSSEDDEDFEWEDEPMDCY